MNNNRAINAMNSNRLPLKTSVDNTSMTNIEQSFYSEKKNYEKMKPVLKRSKHSSNRSVQFTIRQPLAAHFVHSSGDYIRELGRVCKRRIHHNSSPVPYGESRNSRTHNHQNKPCVQHIRHLYEDASQTTSRDIVCYIYRGLGMRLASEPQRNQKFGTNPLLNCRRIYPTILDS